MDLEGFSKKFPCDATDKMKWLTLKLIARATTVEVEMGELGPSPTGICMRSEAGVSSGTRTNMLEWTKRAQYHGFLYTVTCWSLAVACRSRSSP